jgi:hypothetical protein
MFGLRAQLLAQQKSGVYAVKHGQIYRGSSLLFKAIFAPFLMIF